MADRYVPIDDQLESRVVTGRGGSAESPTAWHWDWACPRCERHGHITVHLTNLRGEKDGRTGRLVPQEDDEEVRRLLRQAHEAGSLCIYRDLLLGEMWRWEGTQAAGRGFGADPGPGAVGRRQVFLQRKGKPLTEYAWPPWRRREWR